MKFDVLYLIQFFCFVKSKFGEPITDAPLTVNNIFIAVKTTQKHENSRLPIILNTWFLLAKQQTWFFTDTSDSKHFQTIQNVTNGHMVVTECGNTHELMDLCCKTNHELKLNLTEDYEEQIKWLCLFDDDNYVNIPNLVNVLQNRDYKKDWYIGHYYATVPLYEFNRRQRNYAYAALGAGVCLSRPLVLRIQPHLRLSGFAKLCKNIQKPDDVTLGYLVDVRLGVKLTNLPGIFRSHIHSLKDLRTKKALKTIVTTGHNFNINDQNKRVPGFDINEDPTRFYSLHCLLGYCTEELRAWYKRKLNHRAGPLQDTYIPANEKIPTDDDNHRRIISSLNSKCALDYLNHPQKFQKITHWQDKFKTRRTTTATTMSQTTFKFSNYKTQLEYPRQQIELFYQNTFEGERQ